jgi:hypothetical protein
MSTDKRDSSGCKRFVPGFYPKIGVHPRLSVIEKKFIKKSLNNFSTVQMPWRGVFLPKQSSVFRTFQLKKALPRLQRTRQGGR